MLTHDWYSEKKSPPRTRSVRSYTKSSPQPQADEDLVAYSMALTANEYASSGKVIVLTEGRSDARNLSESLALLYPHIS